MPFISKDWRSPGEEWVKTQEGWEKKKVLECTAQRYAASSNFNNTDDNQQKWNPEGDQSDKITSDSGYRIPPHCRITIKCTKEIAGFNGLSEAVRRLDFSSAVRDVRRFNYICALLELLMGGQRLTHLPGAAQKVLLSMLEELADQVARSQQHVGALRALARAARGAREAERRACWGRPLGARGLWRHHERATARLLAVADSVAAQPGPDVEPKLQDLPEECIREIILRLSDYKDLEAAAAAWPVAATTCGERGTWRRLVAFHFAPRHQLGDLSAADWQRLFHHLRKTVGLREDAKFAETLSLCPHCKCLFWRSLGHPCIADQCPEYRARLAAAGGPLPPRPVPPAAFLEFFSL